MKMQRKNQKREELKDSKDKSPPVPKEVVPKKKLVDLRETVLGATKSSDESPQPQEQSSKPKDSDNNFSMPITKNFQKEEIKLGEQPVQAGKKPLGTTSKPI